MNADVEAAIRDNLPWAKLPAVVKQVRSRITSGAPDNRCRTRGKIDLMILLKLVDLFKNAGPKII